MSNDPPEMRDWACPLLQPSLLWVAGLLCHLRESDQGMRGHG